MATIRIVNVDEDLKQAVKFEALNQKKTMNQFIIDLLKNNISDRFKIKEIEKQEKEMFDLIK